MKLPEIPVPQPISAITPSLYNGILRCKAQAAWGRFGVRNAFPVSPFSLLGTAFHVVVESAVQGILPCQADACREAAYVLFEQETIRLLNESHPFLRKQFPLVVEMPYFYRMQAQAAESALVFVSNDPAAASRHAHGIITIPEYLVECKLVSKDGSINGRVDFVDTNTGVIYDYKSGTEHEVVTDAEARQLRLYTYLCTENDIHVEKAVIVRRNGRQDSFPVTREDAANEASAAVDALNHFNQAVAGGFNRMASPSSKSCAGCQCRALCKSFWEAATPEWAKEVGMCAEAEVQSVHQSGTCNHPLITLQVNVLRGTVNHGVASMPPLPKWAADADGDEPLREGDIIRIIGSKPQSESSNKLCLSRLPGRRVAEIWRVR